MCRIGDREAVELEHRAVALGVVGRDGHVDLRRDVGPDATGNADRRQGRAAGRLLRSLPRPADPHVGGPAAGPSDGVRYLCLDPGQLRLLEVQGSRRIERARLKEADRELRRLTAGRAVGDLGLEVGIEIAVADATQRRTGCLNASLCSGAVQRHVVENVLTPEHPQLTPREELAAVPHAHGQVHLAHVDLCTGSGVVWAAVLNLRRESHVRTEVVLALPALRVEHREAGQEPGANSEVLLATIGVHRVDGERVDVAAERELPAVGHLHRQALSLHGARQAYRCCQQPQRESLHKSLPSCQG